MLEDMHTLSLASFPGPTSHALKKIEEERGGGEPGNEATILP